MNDIVHKCADDITIGGMVEREQGCPTLQQHQDQLKEWAREWLMKFNSDNCEVIHFGKLNQDRTYTVNGRAI